MDAGKSWNATSGPGSQAGTWGGHAIYARSYDEAGVTFITWGQLQHATWAWIAKYVSESYLIIDAINARTAEIFDADKLAAALAKCEES